MEGPDRAIWFAGDLDDPWVAAIAAALPRAAFRIDCPADLPEAWPIDRPTPFAIVLHRSNLTATDAQRLMRLKARADQAPRLVLCVGPHARYADVERWSRLVDVILPEATARESVARHALGLERKPSGNRPRVAIVSTNFELRTTMAEAARLGGFAPEPIVDPADTPPGVVAVWDVPVLEPEWPARLASLAKSSPVVALLGFADRSTVSLARRHGASVCLDLPCDIADLLGALDRLATVRPREPAHDVPPAPMGKKTSRIEPPRRQGRQEEEERRRDQESRK